MKWYWWVLIAIVVIVIARLIWKKTTSHTQTTEVVQNGDGTSKTIISSGNRSMVVSYDKNGNYQRVEAVTHAPENRI